MKNFGTIIDNFDAVTKQYVDNKVPTDEHIKGIKVDNATLADTAKKVQNAFTYKAHDKTDGTAVSISYDGSEAASLDFVADDFAPVYTSGNDLGLKLVDKGYATKTYVDNQDALKLDKAGGSITGNLTVGGNLTINGTTTTVDSTTLQVKDKLIEVAHGNTATLTTPAGLVAPKYDGTNSGALVFDSTGTAYVGDVTLKDGNIDVANSGLQPLATRTGLVGGNLVQYDSTALTLKDSGKKISDLALKTELSGKANLSGGNTFSGVQTINAPTNVSGSEQITMKVKTSNGGAIIFGKEGANSGTMIRLDQADGTCRLRFRSSETAGAMVWEQPEQGAKLHVDLGKDGSDKHRVTFPSSAGTLALTSQVNKKYTKPSGGIPKTDLESDVQTSLGKADNALSLDGGTIKKSKTIKMDASANSDGANLKWGTVNSKNPYIGYASDQVDGTFVVGSLLGTNYASGLAIGGGSGNLLWKGTKVATTSDIPTNYVTTDTDWQEIISTKKFFRNQLIVSDEIDIGASAPAPEANQYRYIDFLDKNDKRIGIVGASIDTNKNYGAYLQAGNVASMGVSSTPDGFVYSYGPIPPDNDNTNKLATTGWVRRNIPFDSNGLSTGTLGSTKLPSAGRYYIEKKASMSQNIISFVLDFNNAATSSSYAYLSAAGDNALGELWLFVYVSQNGTVTMSEYSPKTNGEISFDKDETGTFKYKKLD